MTTCRKCKHLDSGGAKRIMGNSAYKCIVPIPSPAVPYCVETSYGYRKSHVRSWVSPDKEHNCTFFEREYKDDRLQAIPQA